MNRRKFIALTGGGIVLAAGAGAGVFLSTRTPHKAHRPWDEAGTLYKEPRKRALSFAILAPNPHNRQPWLVDLSIADEITLFVDTDRLLPHTDPLNRQITVGLGCFLEIMVMAAKEDGYRVELDLFPEGNNAKALDKRPVAKAIFVKDNTITKDPLFAHVLERRSLKEPFDTTQKIESGILAGIEKVAVNGVRVGSDNSESSVQALRSLTHDALLTELKTARTYKESVDLMRIGKAEVEANPDGIDLTGPFMESMNRLGILTRESALDTSSTAYQQGIDATLAPLSTAMAHLWTVTKTNTRQDQINAGRDWVRINLAATAQGLGLHPLSQSLQEYEEVKPYYNQIHKRLAPEGGTVQMLVRLGYAAQPSRSPRWSLSEKILRS